MKRGKKSSKTKIRAERYRGEEPERMKRRKKRSRSFPRTGIREREDAPWFLERNRSARGRDCLCARFLLRLRALDAVEA